MFLIHMWFCLILLPGTWHLACFPSPTGFHRWSTSSQFPFGGAKNASLLFLVEKSDSECFHFCCSKIWPPKCEASPSSQHNVDEDLRLQVPPVECFSCGDVIPWNHVMKLIWHAYVVLFPLYFMLPQILPRGQLQETAKTSWERNSLVWQVSIDDPHVPSGELEVQRYFLEHWQSTTRWWFLKCFNLLFISQPYLEDFQFDEHLFFRWVG